MNFKKVSYVILGCIGLGLGSLGAALPLLPAFPFLMLQRSVLQEARKSWITGSETPSCIKTTLKAMFRAGG